MELGFKGFFHPFQTNGSIVRVALFQIIVLIILLDRSDAAQKVRGIGGIVLPGRIGDDVYSRVGPLRDG